MIFVTFAAIVKIGRSQKKIIYKVIYRVIFRIFENHEKISELGLITIFEIFVLKKIEAKMKNKKRNPH